MAKKRVLVDACVILPATNIREWNRLCGYFQVETVEEVVKETQRGNTNRRGYTQVDEAHLLATLSRVHPVTDEQRGALADKLAELGLGSIDDGEFDLFAHILTRENLSPDVLILTTADRNAARTACGLHWEESLASLETLLLQSGATAKSLGQLEKHEREVFLAEIRTEVLMARLNKKK